MMEAFQSAQAAQRTILELQTQVSQFQEVQHFHSNRKNALCMELKEFKEVDLLALKAFVQSAAQLESELVDQLDVQLLVDREALLSLEEAGGPKLGLLLNCFGAEEGTIRKLAGLRSMDLSMLNGEEMRSQLANLPKAQQIIVLYAQERLIHGQRPFENHDCVLCECKTAQQMAAFLQERGLQHVTADLILKTGASGRGSSCS